MPIDYEGQSTLDDLLDAGGSALGWVGSILDKPGRAVRGILGARPREALATLPFSDTLGLTKPSQRVSGSDLLDTYGLGSSNGLGEGESGIGGLVTELLTDPLNYLPGAGAATGAGKAAQRTGRAVAPDIATSAEAAARMTRMPTGRVAGKAFDYAESDLSKLANELRANGATTDLRTEALTNPQKSFASQYVEQAVKDVTGSDLQPRVRPQIERGTENPFAIPGVDDIGEAVKPQSLEEMKSAIAGGKTIEPGTYNLSDHMGGFETYRTHPVAPPLDNPFSDLPLGEATGPRLPQPAVQQANKIVDVPNAVPATPLRKGISVNPTPLNIADWPGIRNVMPDALKRPYELGGGTGPVSRGFRKLEDTFLDPGIDKAVGALKNNPVTRYGNSLFDSTRAGFGTDPVLQEQAAKASEYRNAANAEVKAKADRINQVRATDPELAKLPDQTFNDLFTTAMEKPVDKRFKIPETTAEYEQQLSRMLPINGPLKADNTPQFANRLEQMKSEGGIPKIESVMPKIQAIADEQQAFKAGIRGAAEQTGREVHELNDPFIEHAARQKLILPREVGESTGTRFKRSLKNSFTKQAETDLGRGETWSGLQGGTQQAQQLVRHLDLSGPGRIGRVPEEDFFQRYDAAPTIAEKQQVLADHKAALEKAKTEHGTRIYGELADEPGATPKGHIKTLTEQTKGKLSGDIFEQGPTPRQKPSEPVPQVPADEGLFGEQPKRALKVEEKIPEPGPEAAKKVEYAAFDHPLSRTQMEGAKPILTSKPIASAKSVPEQPLTNTFYWVDKKDLNLDPRRLQTRVEFNSKTGSAGTLKDSDKYNPNLSTGMAVWRDHATGRDFVVDGHNRFDKAKDQADVHTLKVIYLPAANEVEARIFGAARNIADGRAAPLDAAQFFRDTGVTVQKARDAGLAMRSEVVEKGLAYANLDEQLFNMLKEGKLTPTLAKSVGENIADPRRQVEFVRSVRNDPRLAKSSPAQIEQLAIQTNLAGEVKKVEKTLFGDDERTQTLNFERANLAGKMKEEYAAGRRAFESLTNKNVSKKAAEGENILQAEKNAQLAESYSMAEEAFNREMKYKSELSDIINKYTEEYANAGTTAAKRTVEQKAIGEAGPAIERASARQSLDDAKNGADVTAPQDPGIKTVDRDFLKQTGSDTNVEPAKPTPEPVAEPPKPAEPVSTTPEPQAATTVEPPKEPPPDAEAVPAPKPPRRGTSAEDFLNTLEGKKYSGRVIQEIRRSPEGKAFNNTLREELGEGEKMTNAKFAEALKASDAVFSEHTVNTLNDFLDKYTGIKQMEAKSKQLQPALASAGAYEQKYGKWVSDAAKIAERYGLTNVHATAGIDAIVGSAGQLLSRVPEEVLQSGPRQTHMPLKELVTKLGGQGNVLTDRILQRAKLGSDTKFLGIPTDAAEDLIKTAKSWDKPRELAPIVAAYEAGLKTLKEYLTFPFPAFVTRNFMSEMFNTWRDGATPSGDTLRTTRDYMSGQPLKYESWMPKAWEKASPEELRANLSTDMHKYGINDRMAMQIGETLPEQIKNLPEAGQKYSTPGQEGWLGFAKKTLQTAWDQAEYKGVGTKAGAKDTVGLRSYIRGMKSINEDADGFVRVGHYIEKLKQGYSPLDAASAVKKYHIDYSSATEAEKHIFKNVFPFWMFSSRSLPPLLEDIATKPGLRSAIRATTSPSLSGGNSPPGWIGENASIAIPGGEEGHQRYISSLGLPFEDTLFKAGASLASGHIKRAGQEALGMTSPLLQFPLQESAGVQFWSGRPLGDVKTSPLVDSLGGAIEGVTGADLPLSLVSRAIGATPAARFLTTANRLVDPRKGIVGNAANLLSGVNISDVDLAAEKSKSIQQILEDRLKDSGNLKTASRVYIPEDKKGTLTDTEQYLYDAYKRSESERSKRIAAQKKEAAGKSATSN